MAPFNLFCKDVKVFLSSNCAAFLSASNIDCRVTIAAFYCDALKYFDEMR